jgi:hypothetical protein
MGRYDVLARRSAPKEAPEDAPVQASRRGNPSYRQFSAYIPLDLYRKLKVRLAEEDLDLSEAIEQAIIAWLQKPVA